MFPFQKLGFKKQIFFTSTDFSQIHIYTHRVSVIFFPDYKHLLQENYLDMLELYVAPQLEEFQPWIIFQQGGAPPHWDSDFRRFLDATFPNRLDWERWSDTLATTITGYHPPLTSFYGGMLRTKCFRHQFQILQI